MTASPSTLHALVLAAGKGTRMRSSRPKALHEIANRPLYGWALVALEALKPSHRTLIVGPDWPSSIQLPSRVKQLTQQERKGTGHALRLYRDRMHKPSGWLMMIYGDTPLVQSATLTRLYDSAVAQGADLAVTAFTPDNPGRYGRLIHDQEGRLARIVEYQDASEQERASGLCNGGLMLMRLPEAFNWIDQLSDANAAQEYYATDLVQIAYRAGFKPIAVPVPEGDVMGVNTRSELAQAEAVMQTRLRAAAMAQGVTMLDPQSVHLSHDTRFAADVLLEPQQVFGPGVEVHRGARLRAFGHYEGVVIGKDTVVGPFARLRPGTQLDEGVKVGNFVEIKAAHLHEGAKVNHLSYIGDAEVGAKANIGAGAITCNYDGFSKHQTYIGAEAFIGSNSALVAPLTIGEGAIVGAGSTLTRDVSAQALALSRTAQSETEGGGERLRRQLSHAARRKAEA